MEDIYITKISTTLYRIAQDYYPLGSTESLERGRGAGPRAGSDELQVQGRRDQDHGLSDRDLTPAAARFRLRG